jgi:hypothetical protein
MKLSQISIFLLLVFCGCSNFWNIKKTKLLSKNYIQDKSFPKDKTFIFKNVSWVTLSPDETKLYILQRGLPAVSVWDLNGNLLQTWSTNKLGDPHSLRFQILPDKTEKIWITDMAPPITAGFGYGHCLKQFSLDGNYLGSIGVCGKNSEGTLLNPVQFDKITDVSFDSKGNIWVSDGDINGLNNRVLQLTPEGQVLQVWSAPKNKPGKNEKQFNLPHALEVDSCDRVFVADVFNHRVEIIRSDGVFLQELKCFGDNGIYGLNVSQDSNDAKSHLITTSNATSSPTIGTVQIFSIDQNCHAKLPAVHECQVEDQWQIDLPDGTSESMLHAVTSKSDDSIIFIALLGGDLPPQKWIKIKQ